MRATAPLGRPTGEAADMASEQDPVGVLYLDVEGGWGGSSRSMYYLIEPLDRKSWRPLVLSRKPGPNDERYRHIGVSHLTIPEMPVFRPGERKNAVAFALFVLSLWQLPRLLRKLRTLVQRYGVRLVHANHESIAPFALFVARQFGLPCVCHIRTQLKDSVFARLLDRIINRFADHLIFIAEPNERHFAALVGPTFDKDKSSIIFNATPKFPGALPPPTEFLDPPGVFRVISLSNFSPDRGVDLLIDVAQELRQRGRDDFVFYLCGRLAHKRLMPGARNRYLDEMVARVGRLGLDRHVRFMGHVSEPQRVLAAGHALIRLRRNLSPWGRDVIEAMMAGLPIVTLGSFHGFVEPGVNGYIAARFSPTEIADYLIELAQNPDKRQRIAAANREKAARLFDPEACASRVTEIYRSVLQR